MSDEEDSEETEVVDAEPLVGSLGGEGHGREEGGGDGGGDGGEGLLQGGHRAEGGLLGCGGGGRVGWGRAGVGLEG